MLSAIIFFEIISASFNVSSTKRLVLSQPLCSEVYYVLRKKKLHKIIT